MRTAAKGNDSPAHTIVNRQGVDRVVKAAVTIAPIIAATMAVSD